MKQLKSFNGFVRESSDEDQKELMGMGFGDKLQLEDPSEIMDAVTDHFNGDDEVMQLVQKLEARLTVLMEEFEQKFEYVRGDGAFGDAADAGAGSRAGGGQGHRVPQV